MKVETLHDAISLLPEELLTPVDRLRQKKRMPWKSITAVAACLCLAVGFFLLNPGNIVAMDSANGGAGASPEMGEPMEGIEYSYGTTEGALVEILSVGDDSLQVFSKPTKESSDKNQCIQLTTLTLTFENLEQVPTVQPGQTLRIYYEPDQLDEDSMTVKPYKIEIEEEAK